MAIRKPKTRKRRSKHRKPITTAVLDAVAKLAGEVANLREQVRRVQEGPRVPKLISFAATWRGTLVSKLESAHISNILARAVKLGANSGDIGMIRGIIACAYEAGKRGLTSEGIGDSGYVGDHDDFFS